jgi:hypothetical protein
VQAFVRSSRPLLLSRGLSEDLVNQLQRNAIREVTEGTCQHYIKYQTVYALKKHPVTDGPILGPAAMPATSHDEDAEAGKEKSM